MRSVAMISGLALALGGCGTSELQMQVDSMRASNQTLAQRVARLEEEQAALRSKLAEVGNIRVPTGISAVPSARRGAAGMGSARPIPATDGSYAQAYALFQAGDVDSAIPAFEQFLRSGAAGAEHDLAQYWLGEAYYNKRNHDLASRYYAAYLKAAPHGERSASALQKLVESLKAMGRAEDARILQEQGVSAIVP
ncbi:MAG: tetratricopeptide repeat protein [Cardiobacteriaceae bacterium]|nr:tetratricopeptide repeat protein [Cardiobacteriaceae bacterium]